MPQNQTLVVCVRMDALIRVRWPHGRKVNFAELGRLTRKARKQLEATQKELAMTSGTGLRFAIDLERGKPTCQIAKIQQVLQALGLRVRGAVGKVAHGL